MNIAAVPTSRQPASWLPLPTVARRLGLRFDTVITLIRTRKLEGRLCGGRRWFVRADSLQYTSRWAV